MTPRLFLAAALVGLTSCSLTPPEAGTTGARFYEGDKANLVIRFYSWNSIQITRPNTREAGFLPLFDREGAVKRLDQLQIGRDLAVVVLGSMFSRAQEQEIIQQWHQILDPRGFRRLVLLRAGFRDDINGLRIVYDSGMNRADAPPAPIPVARSFAQVATATGAHVAHSSGTSGR
ncbi:MAG: hypothetical protein N3I86_00590 [Verrucomicrobiae bacterium]|nr:hypothetical protein [Verrucomicrobiae bacterium]